MEIFITSHSTYLHGPAQYLESHFRRKKYNVFHLTHPLDIYNNRKSLLYVNGRLKKEYKRIPHNIFNLFEDLFLTLNKLYKTDYDVYIGTNNFDTLSGIIANRLFNKKTKIIFFATDFSEDRFKNMLLDLIYIAVEKIVIKNSNLVISNTYRAQKKRIEFGLDPKRSEVISNGVFLNKPVFKNKNISKDKFIYIGNVTKEHGIVEYIKLMHKTMKEIVIIGSGRGWNDLISLLKRNKIKYKLFLNKSHEFVIDFLQDFNGFGLAPYNKNEGWTYYASPLKIVEYIATGVPVITSDVTELSKMVTREQLGIVYQNIDYEKLSQEIGSYDVKDYYKKSQLFYKKYNYNQLFNKIKL